MLRRSFLGAIGLGLASLLGCKVSSNNSLKLKAPIVGDGYGWDTEPVNVIWDDKENKWIKDPFIKIHTKNGFTTDYGIHRFYQYLDNNVTYSCKEDKTLFSKTTMWIPLDNKQNQKSKSDMIRAVKKEWKNKDILYFEIIADNGLSNLFAVGGDV